MCPRDREARLQTTKSPGTVFVTTTVSPSMSMISGVSSCIAAMFWAISVQRFEA